jgi:hypothetical protein
MKQSLEKATSDEVKKQLLDAIEFASTHVQRDSLVETILKNFKINKINHYKTDNNSQNINGQRSKQLDESQQIRQRRYQ